MQKSKKTVQQEPAQSAKIEFNMSLPPINLWSINKNPEILEYSRGLLMREGLYKESNV